MQYHVKSVNGVIPDDEGNVQVNVTSDVAEKAYTESPTFTGSLSPSGVPTNRWQAEVRDSFCTIIIVLQYPTDGNGITGCSIPLPADAPVPKLFTGMTNNNGDFFYPAIGTLTRTTRTQTSTLSRVQLSRDTSLTSGYTFVCSFSSAVVGTVTIIATYPIA